MATIFTIYDAGGNDTLDLSAYYTPSAIDLREGGYSSAGDRRSYDPSLLSMAPRPTIWARPVSREAAIG
jgi:serralysin